MAGGQPAADGAYFGAKAGASPSRLAAKETAPAKPLPERRQEAKEKAQAAPPPATVYWQPLLLTDAAGQATVRFSIPAAGPPLHIRVEADANGRAGFAAATLPR